MTSAPKITPDLPLPDLFQNYPQTRAVFNRYGLRGCGGHNGPTETIGFYATAHEIDLAGLLDQLHQVVTNDTLKLQAEAQLAKDDATPRLIDAIYQPFFLAAMVTMLTAGAGMGIWLLWRIGQQTSYTGVDVLAINAHGHAQIMGWLGLFIMGFAYQAFPRMWQVEVPWPKLAVVVFVGMLVGITLSSLGMFEHDRPWASVSQLVGFAIELVAVVIFVTQMVVAYGRSEQRLRPYHAFIFAALVCLVLQTIYSGWHAHRLIHAGNLGQIIAQVSGWQPPLRNLQFHGLALLIIIGVAIRVVPAFYGVKELSNRRAWIVFGLLLGACVTEVSFFSIMTLTGSHGWGAMLILPWVLLPVGVGLIVWTWKLWRPLPVTDRSAKFIRMSFFWLMVSLVMLLLLPVYFLVQEKVFSHAYYGSISHAFVVGFVSLMIVGMSAKVVPTLRGVNPDRLPGLWVPFVLINLGCLMRVVFQIGTDWDSEFYKFVGISGVLEWIGFALWAGHLVAVMAGWGRYALPSSLPTVGEAGEAGEACEPELESQVLTKWGPVPPVLLATHKVTQVLDWHPELEAVFVEQGFDMVTKPMLRKTVGEKVTLQQACMMKNVSVEAFVSLLNDARNPH